MVDINSEPRGVPLTTKQRIAWLRLIRSDNVGPINFRDMINHCGSAERALEMLPELSLRGGATRVTRIFSQEEAEKELEKAERFGARFVGLGEPEYPPALRYTDSSPPLLAVKGDIRTSTMPIVGIVGTRNASIGGTKFTALITQEIAKAGYVIVSGLARGIDTAAHRASLSTGTIVVMAGGLDCPYPPENVDLLEEIWNGTGLAITEMPFGWEPRAYDFPRRNRIIAGTGIGLVVVEAAKRSGSLITARFAGQFGRLVFAVPGSPLDPRCKGTNDLIKDGAILITSGYDVIQALKPQIEQNFFSPSYHAEDITETNIMNKDKLSDNERIKVAQALSYALVYIDDIIEHTRIEPPMIYLALLELDLAGPLCRHPGGAVSLTINLPDH